ncbi:hypothetical protein FOL47_006555 [Perkinsus chesapeaki]|uniref:EF-hand domain-containing protein n=1 Tax=Perkinsus chesapeaki TaxID=330153 RepID=A0A7J6LR08_PERCH|nr:hypothetical protein FOL47_006555 [Perkinsus chesapeaki]
MPAATLTESLTCVLDGCDSRRQRRRRWMTRVAGKLRAAEPAGLTRDDLAALALKRFIDVHRPHLDANSVAPTDASNDKPAADPLEVVWMAEVAPHSSGMWDSFVPFLQAIVGQGSTEQKKKWVPRIMKMDVIGSYCQTELGHGSNVRGLETTATFTIDEGRRPGFVLHTPTLTATKWWPGGLALAATHAVVDHRLLAGIEAGELGPKMGEDSHDSGWLQLHRVKVPLEALLAGKGQVSPDGRFIPNPDADKRLEHSSMVATRAGWISLSGGLIAKAATIATRYSHVRRQGRSPHSPRAEARLIDHDTQAGRLLRGISTAYVFKLAGYWLLLDSKNHPDWLIAALKGLTSAISADLVEDLRRCCGGNGYLLNSGIARISLDNMWRATAEGDVQVLLSYAGRRMRNLSEADLFDEMPTTHHPALKELRNRAQSARETARNGRNTILDTSAARAYSEWILAKWAWARLAKLTPLADPQAVGVVERFIRFYSYCTVAMPCCSATAIPRWAPQADFHTDFLSLVRELRPLALSAVDAFEYTDEQLHNTTLGRKDGKVYEALLEAAKESPWSRGIPEQVHDVLMSLHSKLPWKSLNTFNPRDYERPGLKQDEIEELKDAFDLFDTDSSGEICLAELKAAMKSLGYE